MSDIGFVQTVPEMKARKFLDLVKSGKEPKEAAKEIGTTLAALRKSGALAKACREMIQRADEEKLLDKTVREKLVKARLTELMMQDDNIKVALGAAKAIQNELGVGTPLVGVQVNAPVKDIRVATMLKSLQLEVDGGEDAQTEDEEC